MLRVWIIFLAVNSCLGGLTWREQPNNQLAFEGNMVRLRCSTATGLGTADHHHWVRLNPTSGQQTFLSDGAALSPALSADVRARFDLHSNHIQGQFELIIKQARWYDSGQYGCIVYNRVASRRIITRLANVNVVKKEIPEGSPECSLVPAHPGPGDLVAFSCSSLVHNALSQLSWSRGSEIISSSSVLNDQKKKVVTFHRRLRDMDNHAVYTCTEKYPLENSPRTSCSLIPFDIPMNVSLRPVSISTLVGTPVIFSCEAHAVPPITRYMWLFDGHPVIEKPDVFQLLDGGKRLKIKGVLAAAAAQYEIRCKVSNALNMRRSAIGFLKVSSSAVEKTLDPDQGPGSSNATAMPKRSNKSVSGDKSKVTLSDRRKLPKVRGTPMSILLASTTGVGATILLILIVVIVVCLRRRARKEREIEDDVPRILEISSPKLGQVEEPVPPVRETSKSRQPVAPVRGSSMSRGPSSSKVPTPPLPGVLEGHMFPGDEQSVFEDITRHYNKQMRPVRKHTDQVVVNFTIKLKQIVDIDERNQILKLNIQLNQSWTDELLKWDPTAYGGTKELRFPANQVWRPDTTLYNTGDPKDYAYGNSSSSNVILQHDGFIRLVSKPFVQQSTCKIRIRYFPFDMQECTLKFGSWTYTQEFVDLLNSTQTPDFSDFLPNEQWDLTYAYFVRNVLEYICCPDRYVDVTLYLGLRRKPLYYLVKLVMPIVLLSGLSMVGFLMPYNVGVIKASLSVTLTLSMTVFLLLVAETIPRTSDSMPLITEYYIIIMVLIAVSTAMNVAVLNIFHRGESGKREVPEWLRKLVLNYTARVLCMGFVVKYWKEMTSERKRRAIDPDRLAMIKKQRWFAARYGVSYTPLVANDLTGSSGRLQKNTKIHAFGGCGGDGDDHDDWAGFEEHLSETGDIRLSNLEQGVDNILKHLKTMRRKTDRRHRIQREWALFATVIDRLLFCIYACFTISMSVTVLVITPAQQNRET
ncbi:uncharacterized protein [Diadema setosum]|uniref:uncharacterized protein n=1 Tax=Diadema setosum TaxID=31175 RepID=UPI003B3B78C9